MVTYTLALQALKVECPLLQGGHSYVVILRRRGLEVASHPQRCIYNGEVAMTPGSAKGYTIIFNTVKDRRTIDVSIEEVGAKGKTKLAEFKFDLIDQCNVFARQACHVIRDFPFRSGGVDGVLQVSLLMFPEGSGPPAPPKADGPGGATTPTGAGNGGGKRKQRISSGVRTEDAAPGPGFSRLSAEALRVLSQNLSQNHIVAGLSTRTTLPEDIAQEIEVLIQHLLQQQQDPVELDMLENDTAELSAELKRLQEKNEAYGREAQLKKVAHQQRLAAVATAKKQHAGGGSGGGMGAAAPNLSGIIASLKEQIREAEYVRQQISAQAAIAASGGVGCSGAAGDETPPSDSMVSPVDVDLSPLPTTMATSTFGAAVAGTPEIEYLTDLKTEHRQALGRLELLTESGDAIQSEDALEEVGTLLETISSLELLISESEAAITASPSPPPPQPPTAASRGQQKKATDHHKKKGLGPTKKKKRVQFADSAAGGGGPVADTPVNRLFHHHVELERLQFSIQRLEAIIAVPAATESRTTLLLPPLPDQLQCVTRAAAAGAQKEEGEATPALLPPPSVPKKTAVVDDLFGPSVPPSGVSLSAAVTTSLFPTVAAAAPSSGFDDLFTAVPTPRTSVVANSRVPAVSVALSSNIHFNEEAGAPPTLSASSAPILPHQQQQHTSSAGGSIDLFGEGGGSGVPSTTMGVVGSAPPSQTTSLFDSAPPLPPPVQQVTSLFDGGGGVPSAANDLFASGSGVGGSGQADLFNQQQPPPLSQQGYSNTSNSSGGGVDSLFAASAPPSQQQQHQNLFATAEVGMGMGVLREGSGDDSSIGGVQQVVPGVMDFSAPRPPSAATTIATPQPPVQQHIALNESGVLRIMFRQVDSRTLQGEVVNLHPHLMLEQFQGKCEGEELFGPPLPLTMKLHGGNRTAPPKDGVLHFLIQSSDSSAPSASSSGFQPGFSFLLVVDGYHGQQHIQRSARLFWS